MTDEQLKIFMQVAEAGSFSKAELKMHVSKQAMLKQINHLEAEIGVQLFTRSRRGIVLTEPGAIFRKGITKMEREMDLLIKACKKAADPGSVIRVGNVEHQTLLTPVTQAFAKQYPNIQIQHVIHPNHSGEWRVENGIQDVAETFAYAYAQSSGGYSYQPLTKVPYVAAVHKGHPLTRLKKVDLTVLSGWEVVYFPVMLERHYVAAVREAFSGHGEHLIERDDVDHQVDAAYECLGSDKVLLTANPFIAGIEELVKIPLLEGWMREYGIIYKEPMHAAVRKYVALAQEIYQNTGEHFERTAAVKHLIDPDIESGYIDGT